MSGYRFLCCGPTQTSLEQSQIFTRSFTNQRVSNTPRPSRPRASRRDLRAILVYIVQNSPKPTTTIESRKIRIPCAGRLWLDAIPSSTSLTLSDDDITANLHYRTLLAGHSGTCSACAAPNLSLHDEGCPGRQDFRVSCHDSVKHILAAGLRQIPQMQVEVEPFLPDLRRRNDIRVHAVSDLHADLHEEYDPKVMVLRAASNQRSLATANVATADTSIFKQTAERVQILLTRNAKKKVSAVTVD